MFPENMLLFPWPYLGHFQGSNSAKGAISIFLPKIGAYDSWKKSQEICN